MKQWVMFAILFYSAQSSAVVAFDAVGPSSSGAVTSTLSLSWSHTCTGTNLLLIVGAALGDNPDSPTLSATYNGVAMTSAGKIHANNGTAGYVQMFYLVNPPTGAHTVVVTDSSGVPYSVIGGSISFTGVNQSTPIRNATTAAGSGTSASVTVSSASGNMVVDVMTNGNGITSSAQTLRWMKNDNGDTAAGNVAQSTAAGAASVQMNYAFPSDWWGIIALDVVAATGTTSVRHKVIAD